MAQKLEFHDLVELFPEMEPDEAAEVKASIQKRGVQNPVVLWRGKVIDGRHRARFCQELGIPVPTRTIECEEHDLLGVIFSLNMHRRHLTSSQRAAIAAQARLVEKVYTNGGKPGRSAEPQGRAIDRAAKMAGTNRDALQKAENLRDTNPKLLDEVAKGKLSVDAATTQAAAEQEPEVQQEEKVLDGLGLEVPSKLEPVFSEADAFDELVKKLRSVRAMAKELSEGPAGEFLARGLQQITAQLKGIETEVAQSKPYTAAPKGSKAQTPWITKRIYELLDEQIRDKHEGKKDAA